MTIHNIASRHSRPNSASAENHVKVDTKPQAADGASAATPSPPLSMREQQELEKLYKDIEKNMAVITLVQGALDDGTAHYAYALIARDKYRAFKLAEMSGSYNLADYGTIVAHGEGLFPPAHVQEQMRETYNADPNYGDHVINTLTHCAEIMAAE